MQSLSLKYIFTEWLGPILLAIVIAFGITIFIGRLYVVEGASMENTLYNRERLVVDKLSYRFIEPKRGEIIVLKTPHGEFIKRIIAVSNDVIEERQGVIYLNGGMISEPYVTNKTNSNWGPYKTPAGHYWVMGDNRSNSADSRSIVGFLKKEDIVGRAVLRFWPFSQIGYRF